MDCSRGEAVALHVTVQAGWELGCTGQGRWDGSLSMIECWWEEYRNKCVSEARRENRQNQKPEVPGPALWCSG